MNKSCWTLFLMGALLITFFTVGECTTPSHKRANKPTELVTISIIDRNGLTETFTNKERLQQFQKVDFLKNQPYQKVLRVFARDKQGNIRALVTSYHPNGQLKQYLEVVNSRAYGVYKEWHANGTLKLETNVIGGNPDINIASERTWLFHGVNTAWDDNGNLLAEIKYEKGELEGPSIYFHESGKVWKRAPFIKGKLHGFLEIFQADGSLLQSTEYREGEKVGKAVRYWRDKRVASEEFYEKGRLITGSYFDFNGNQIAEIKEGNGYRAVYGKESISELQEYKKGEPEGEVKVFGKDGTLAQLYHTKKSLRHGEEINYQEGSNKPSLSINWYEGKIQGVVKTWYDNGVLESQKELSGNKKNGLSLAWYYDGNLMLIEEYQEDKLIRGEYYKKGDKIPLTEIAEGKGIATLFDPEGNFIRKISYNNSVPLD